MARFEDNTKGTWFYLDEDNHEAGRICLRELTIDEIEEIERKTVKHEMKVVRGIAYDDSKINEKRARKLRMEKAIVDWENIYIGNDAELAECNDVNKVRIMKKVDFVKTLGPILDKLNESNKALEEAKAKNVGNLADGNVKEEK